MSTFVLVHGAWQGAWSWDKVTEEMGPNLQTEDGSKVLSLNLPGHGARAADEIRRITMDHYIHAVVTLVQVNRIRDAVLVGHGFAGTFLPQVAQELGENVKQVVFIAGDLPPEGATPYARFSPLDKLMLRVFKAGEKGFQFPGFVFKSKLCNLLDGDTTRALLSRLVPEPFLPWRTPAGRMGFLGRFPTTYVVLTRDKLIPPRLQRRFAHSLGPSGERDGVTIKELEAGHAAPLSHPRELARLLLEYA